MELFDLTALELGAKIQAGEISAVEAARACLERIEKLEPVVHAFVTVTPEAALARAEEVQKKIDAGELKHPLAGVPMAIKDLISTKGVRTTCASKMLENYVPVFDATVVKKLDAIGCGLSGQDEYGRVRDGLDDGVFLFWCDAQTRGTRTACRAARPADRRQRLPRARSFMRWEAIRAGQSASLRRSAA